MFNTKDIDISYGDPLYNGKCRNCGDVNCINFECLKSNVDKIFELWLTLSNKEKLEFAERKIKWHNKNING